MPVLLQQITITKMAMTKNVFSILLLILISFIIFSCEKKITENKQDLKMEINQTLFNLYDSSEINKFGQVNPEAPQPTNEFDFMIGNFLCKDSLLVNGQWKYSEATWETSYILNGYAIKDTYRNNNYAGTSI